MTEKELKKLSRIELLEMLIEQTEKSEELERKLAEAEAKLNDKNINILEMGSLAEACLKINKVFEAADAAAQQYLENIQDCEGKCKQMLADTESRCIEMELAAKAKVSALKSDVDMLSKKWIITSEE